MEPQVGLIRETGREEHDGPPHGSCVQGCAACRPQYGGREDGHLGERRRPIHERPNLQGLTMARCRWALAEEDEVGEIRRDEKRWSF